MEEWVEQSEELEMVVPRISFNVCFRFRVTEGESNSFNLALRTRLYKEGTSLVGIAYIEGDLFMRLLITNPAADRSDIESFFQSLIETGWIILKERDN